MSHIDVIARAIDWLDACRSSDWQSVIAFYAPDAKATIPGDFLRQPTAELNGVTEIQTYWRDTFAANPSPGFELVEFYPGHDSAILIYYDSKCQRISEFLQFDSDGFIIRTARHLIPQRRQGGAKVNPPELGDERQRRSAVLHCEARQSLGEARRLPVGPARNALRQRALALRELARRQDTVMQ